ncbi:MAG TPA: MBL fold metallo-hydrolase [Verrucomicrobiae bacterium]|nr:MBL fold metallo-hydrolase [Verrucomicrobiae bacterium]
MRVTTLGTADAFGAAGRFHSAVVVRSGNVTALVDCGPCILPALYRSNIAAGDIDFILVTHLHGDHVGGVPMLLLDYQYLSCRKRPLTIVGSALCRAHLEALTELMYAEVAKKRRRFPVVFKTIRPGHPISIRGMRIRAYRMQHIDREPCLGYRIEHRGKILAITGDTTWCDSIPAMSHGADLLLAECTDFDQRTPVHTSYTLLREHQAELGAKRIVLTHVGADLLKNRAKVRHHIARDGERFDL